MSRRFKSKLSAKVGDYIAEYWPSKFDSATGTYGFKPPKPFHRKQLVSVVTDRLAHPDAHYAAQGYTHAITRYIDGDELLNADMTVENADLTARSEQARELVHRGYHGPIGGGEARVLKSLFTEMGMPDLVKHGWFHQDTTVTRHPSRWQVRRAAMWGNPAPQSRKVEVTRLNKCYVFKSPMEGVHFSKFIKLCRMYQDDKTMLREAVRGVLANPEAINEVETLDTLEILAGMPGME